MVPALVLPEAEVQCQPGFLGCACSALLLPKTIQFSFNFRYLGWYRSIASGRVIVQALQATAEGGRGWAGVGESSGRTVSCMHIWAAQALPASSRICPPSKLSDMTDSAHTTVGA